MVIHPDGTAHYYVCGDVSPEKKAKIEAQMKAEDEEKAKRRRQYLERSEEAAEKRRQIEEINMQKSKKDAAFDDNISAVNVLSEVDMCIFTVISNILLTLFHALFCEYLSSRILDDIRCSVELCTLSSVPHVVQTQCFSI